MSAEFDSLHAWMCNSTTVPTGRFPFVSIILCYHSSSIVSTQSQQLAVAAFECDWVGKSPEMMKDLLFFMHRAQDPVVLQLPGITDALTLEFYTGVRCRSPLSQLQ